MLNTDFEILFYRNCGEPSILSFTGCYGDDESVLKWRKDPNEVNTLLIFHHILNPVRYVTRKHF